MREERTSAGDRAVWTARVRRPGPGRRARAAGLLGRTSPAGSTAHNRKSGMRRFAVVLLALVLAAGIAGPAPAHKERPAVFPDGTGSVPAYRPMVADPHLVVCAGDSKRRIGRIADAALRQSNEALLA